MNILAVDDDDIVLELVQHLLEAEGHTVFTASNGHEAMETLQREQCQMVILDWEMPGISGIEVCRAIRCGDHGGYVYIILLTSHNSTAELVEAMTAGADDFVSKPFNSAELRMRVSAGIRMVNLETRDALIFTLAKLAESRDPETGHHLERVQRYSRALAQTLGRSSEYSRQIDFGFVRNIYLTSALHDIGKVGVPDSILLKPGKLTAEEFRIMQQHTVIGAETLLEAVRYHPHARYLKMAHEIAIAHHERYDGTGYPYGLQGEDIPLAARIVSLADVYDALTTRRVYKEAYTHEHATEIITTSSGTHFDPVVVEAFLNCQTLFLEIRRQFDGSGLPQGERLTCQA